MPAITRGTKLSHFEVLEKLGEGGMGVVYKARDLRLDRFVAIKLLPEQALGSADRQARFEQEAKAASALNHPNIITVHEIDRAGDATFIAMEYVDGRTLDHAIAHKGLRFPEVLKYAVQITDALAAAHGIGIVHRDLKPANLMITGKGLVKVLDFGLAKHTHSATEHAGTSDVDATVTMQSEAGQLVGTTPYMSPEQAQAQPIDARSDIFSFGVVLYEMLTGRRPFAGDTKLSTLNAIVNHEPPSVKQIVEGVPPELDRIIARCLRKDPARRFQTMADLHVTLEELKEESDSGRIASAAALQRPHRRAWPWAGAAALLVIAALAVWLIKRFATQAPPQMVMPVTTYPGSQRYPCFSPDGSQVAFSWDGDNGGNFDIYVKLLGESNALRLTTDPAADLNPAWSPDGKRIAFERSGPNGGIYTTSPLGGAEQRLTDFPARGQMSWSPDGKWLAVSSLTSESSGIFLLPVEGGEPRQISNPKPLGFDVAPSFSRDGRLLAYAACFGPVRLYSCDITAQDLNSAYAPQGSPRRISDHAISLVRGMAWSHDGESLISDGEVGAYMRRYLWRIGAHGHGPPQRIELAGPNAASPSVAPTGNHMVFSSRASSPDIWRYQIGGGMEPLIVSSLDDRSPQFSPDGTKIVFASDRSGEALEIWLARADGSGAVQMTNRLGRHQGSPSWSPDGRWIAFDSQGQDGHWDIYVVNASGGMPRRITFEPSDENVPSWSRDGKWIYCSSNRTGRTEIWRVPFAGGSPERLRADGNGQESADGKTLFYIKSDRSPLFAKPLSGGPETQVLPLVAFNAFVPVEDGIYYIGQQGEDRKYPLEFFQFSSNTSRLLAKIEGALDTGFSVSPDRRSILFSKRASNGENLMMIENFR